ncbi:MAG: UDP-N-acetylglucosamine 1-carboxyvinyltransferase [Fimbriimonadaceae bacterium]|nr:UDP-N-acetylglucosamine 1-carboxyvinyltransferase [Fimbriimonadaceae bacterium]
MSTTENYIEKSESGLTYHVSRSRLEGTVQLSGAKNSVLKLLPASLLTAEPVTLTNFPTTLLDAQVNVGMLRALGKKCVERDGAIHISQETPPPGELNWPHRSIRITLLILGALLARTGYGAVPVPGGCKLGDRKYDHHEMVLTKLGARVFVDDQDRLAAEAPNGLEGTDIYLPIRSTGATENAIIAGSLARGVTRVWNPHIRPEITDLCEFLRKMGVPIIVHGQEHIEVHGQEGLSGTKHDIIADNMEALTWLVGSVVTGGDIEFPSFPFADLEVPLIQLRESGAKFYRGDQSLIVRGGRPLPIEISTGPYPGINSDMQPLFAVYGALAKGISKIVDLRFPGRYNYAEELVKMGGHCYNEDNLLVIEGGRPLTGAGVRATDLRAGIALTLAGLTADGETVITDAWQVERGYDRFVEKLQSLGGNIRTTQKA